MSPDPELLGDEPVRLGRREGRPEPNDETLGVEPLPPWRPPRWLVVVVLLVAVVGTAGWYVDRQERAHETRALDACRRDLRSAVALSDLRLMAMADYLDPALSVTTGAQHGRLADDMALPARRVVRDVERADRVCRAVSVRPWHFALVARQRATTAYSAAFAARIRMVADRGRRYYRDDGDLQRLREAAAIPVDADPF
ncbi:MAG: hypothetical protein WAV00_24255 [Nocardioides sp.]